LHKFRFVDFSAASCRSLPEKLRDSEGHEHLHHILTVAVTLLHVAIAIATIAVIMHGQRWP
jgi:hypothetical protein